MEKPDVNALAQKMIEAVRGYVSRAEAAISQRLTAAEAKIATIPAGEKGDKGDPGEAVKGEKGDRGERGESIKGEKGDQGASIKGDRGEPGHDGKDADSKALEVFVHQEVRAALEAMPKPKDGKDGSSLHPDTVALMVRDAAEKVAAALPKPKDGLDGLGLEDFDMALSEDGRTLSFRFVRGEVKVERQVKLATLIYREVWRDGEYERGDVVTWGGSAWHCQQQTKDKPGTSGTWRLMVKEGARGKDGGATSSAAREPVKLR